MDSKAKIGRTPVPLLDLSAQYCAIEAEVGAAIARVVRSQNFILGPEVEQLEREIARYCSCGFGIGVSSGTDALLVALMGLGIGSGDEVITTPYTFFATGGCISRVGAKPVFVDIDRRTYNMDPAKLEAAVSEKTRAILPVHLFGQMATMDPIVDIARRNKLHIVEDAAQAIGSEDRKRRAGSLGDLGCFSFFPSKNLGGFGDGGMITTHDPDLAERVSILRSHGSKPKYYHRLIGGNFRLDALQAAVLRVKLPYLDGWTAARQRNAAAYGKLFAEAKLASGSHKDPVLLPYEAPEVRHIYNQYVIRVAERHRDKLLAHLKQSQIGCEIYYPVPLHLQECFARLGFCAGDFPESEAAAKETIALPIYPELTESMQAAVVQSIADYFSE